MPGGGEDPALLLPPRRDSDRGDALGARGGRRLREGGPADFARVHRDPHRVRTPSGRSGGSVGDDRIRHRYVLVAAWHRRGLARLADQASSRGADSPPGALESRPLNSRRTATEAAPFLHSQDRICRIRLNRRRFSPKSGRRVDLIRRTRNVPLAVAGGRPHQTHHSVSATLSDSERGVAERLGTEVATRGDRGGLDVAVEAAPEGHPSGSVPGWCRAGLRTGVLAGCRDDTDLGSPPSGR